MSANVKKQQRRGKGGSPDRPGVQGSEIDRPADGGGGAESETGASAGGGGRGPGPAAAEEEEQPLCVHEVRTKDAVVIGPQGHGRTTTQLKRGLDGSMKGPDKWTLDSIDLVGPAGQGVILVGGPGWSIAIPWSNVGFADIS